MVSMTTALPGPALLGTSTVTPTSTMPLQSPGLITIRAAVTDVANSVNDMVASAVITSAPTPTIKPDIKVGPIPLPAFIGLIFFGPFFLTFIIWIAYRKAIYPWKNNHSAKEEKDGERKEGDVSKDIEMQVQGFSTSKPKPRVGKQGNSSSAIGV
jgi:hypothetical protein